MSTSVVNPYNEVVQTFWWSAFKIQTSNQTAKKTLQLYCSERIKYVPHPETIVMCSVLFSVEVRQGDLESKRRLAGQSVEFVKAKPALACKICFHEIILLHFCIIIWCFVTYRWLKNHLGILGSFCQSRLEGCPPACEPAPVLDLVERVNLGSL